MNKSADPIIKRINQDNKLYQLADRQGKIKILELAKLSYPANHIDIIYIDMQINNLKKVVK